MEPKLGVTVANIRSIIPFELMLPLNNWFGVVLFQIFYIEIYNKMAMISFRPSPAEQFGLPEVCYLSSNYLSIHWGAPFFVCLQVNEPYFSIISVQHNNLLRTDHLNIHTPQSFTFHFLPEQGLSVAVSVEKKNYSFSVSAIVIVLLSLLLDQ